jgi:hypothetical protein
MTSFKPNWKGFEAMANGPEARAIVKAEAERAKAIAEGLAQDFRITGDYADSFEVQETTVGPAEGFKHRHAAARLANTSDHAAAVEWGNEHAHKAHRVLGRTLDAMSGE